jgi:hypothetical protein
MFLDKIMSQPIMISSYKQQSTEIPQDSTNKMTKKKKSKGKKPVTTTREEQETTNE